MTKNTCLCRLRFKSVVPSIITEEAKYDELIFKLGNNDHSKLVALEVVADSAVQPHSFTTQEVFIARDLLHAQFWGATLEGKVVLFTGTAEEEETNHIITYCRTKKVAAVLVKGIRHPLAEASIPVFALTSDIVDTIMASDHWTVSIDVLSPLPPGHMTLDSATSSVVDEKQLQLDESTVTPTESVSEEEDKCEETQLCGNKASGMESKDLATAFRENQTRREGLLHSKTTGCQYHGTTIMEEEEEEEKDVVDDSKPPSEAEMSMRRWLNDRKLPHDLGDKLARVGVRGMDDIILLVQSNMDHAILNEMSALDMLKLQRATREVIYERSIVGRIIKFCSKVWLDVLYIALVVRAVRTAGRLHWYHVRESGMVSWWDHVSGTNYCAFIILASLIRAIWMALPKKWQHSFLFFTDTENSHQNAIASFLSQVMITALSLSFLGIFILISVRPIQQFWDNAYE